MQRGKFITFEGGEGCGKSTQIRLLSEALNEKSIPHIITREPGGTPLAERIRPLLVEPNAEEDWDPLAETLLFFAARVQHIKTKIEPTLAAGKWVLCDRFADSTFVYQGVGKGLGVERLKTIQESLLGAYQPDQTFLLDIDPTIGLTRAKSRNDQETRFEDLDFSFHQSLRQGFLELAKQERFTVIDAESSIEEVQKKILAALFS
jgi:dTMP kinase